MGKREYYSRKDIARTYDSIRFGGRSGKYVDKREIEIVKRLIGDIEGKILDVATGTGRFAISVDNEKRMVVASDFSLEMLRQAKKKKPLYYIRADAFNLPFPDNCFNVSMSLRFLLHYEDFESILSELVRVTCPGGYIIFDTYAWSPQTSPIFSKTFDGKVYIHEDRDIIEFAKKNNIIFEKKEKAFLFSPTIYRFIPYPGIIFLHWLESRISDGYRVRTFWKFKKLE